jgi:uncharacterized phage-associated protein
MVMHMNKFELANYIIAKYSGEITPLKLQKLMYYCYVWQLVSGDKRFDASFEAWPHGPVEPDVYHKYKEFGSDFIPAGPLVPLEEPLLDFILDSYGVFSARELSKTTHLEAPWRKNKDNSSAIPDHELLAYYSKQVFAKNFPLAPGKTFYPPKTSSHYSFTFDMEKGYVPEFKSLDDYLSMFSAEKERLQGFSKWHVSEN